MQESYSTAQWVNSCQFNPALAPGNERAMANAVATMVGSAGETGCRNNVGQFASADYDQLRFYSERFVNPQQQLLDASVNPVGHAQPLGSMVMDGSNGCIGGNTDTPMGYSPEVGHTAKQSGLALSGAWSASTATQWSSADNVVGRVAESDSVWRYQSNDEFQGWSNAPVDGGHWPTTVAEADTSEATEPTLTQLDPLAGFDAELHDSWVTFYKNLCQIPVGNNHNQLAACGYPAPPVGGHQSADSTSSQGNCNSLGSIGSASSFWDTAPLAHSSPIEYAGSAAWSAKSDARAMAVVVAAPSEAQVVDREEDTRGPGTEKRSSAVLTSSAVASDTAERTSELCEHCGHHSSSCAAYAEPMVAHSFPTTLTKLPSFHSTFVRGSFGSLAVGCMAHQYTQTGGSVAGNKLPSVSQTLLVSETYPESIERQSCAYGRTEARVGGHAVTRKLKRGGRRVPGAGSRGGQSTGTVSGGDWSASPAKLTRLRRVVAYTDYCRGDEPETANARR